MDKARITVRLSGGQAQPGREDVRERPSPNPTPPGSAGSSGPSGTLHFPSSHHRQQPRTWRQSPSPGQRFRPPAGLRYLVRHWVLPTVVALTVGTLLGGICVAVFTRSGAPLASPVVASNLHLYTIQVGAFSESARAKTLAASLETRGITAKLSGGAPTLVLVGVTTDPAIPGPFGDMLRNMKLPLAVKQYRPPAPPGQIPGVTDSKVVAQALEKSVDLLGVGIDEWSQGPHNPRGLANLDQGLQEVGPVLERGVQELRAAGRTSQADRLEKWKQDLEAVVNGIRGGEAPGPLMGATLQAIDDYEQLIADLSPTAAPRSAPGG